MGLDSYAKNLIDGLIFYGAKPVSTKFLGQGGWGTVYLIVFDNGKELVIKTCQLYYKNYHEIQNIKRLTKYRQSPYVCHYYGYTIIENRKFIFVSNDTNLKFTGVLKEVPDKILKSKIIPEKTFSYFNIIMEKLVDNIEIDKFGYKQINIIYLISFMIACLKAIRDISKSRVVHGDIHKLENVGFIKASNGYYAPKLLDFGSIKNNYNAFIDKSDNWKLKTFKKVGYYKWPPEIMGCIDSNNHVDKIKYFNDKCDIKKSFAVKNSDVFMFVKGIILDDVFGLGSFNFFYMNKHDDVYKELNQTLYNKINENIMNNREIFNNDNDIRRFVEKFINIILDCIEPDYKIRPIANDVIMRLYKCLQTYMKQDYVDKIYQPIMRAYFL